MTVNDALRVAAVAFKGLGSGGTERFMQEAAAGLSARGLDVTYFWTSLACGRISSGEAEARRRLVAMGVRPVQVGCGGKRGFSSDHRWKHSELFVHMDEFDYDVIITGRDGTFEYPYSRLSASRIVDTIHYLGGVDILPGTRRVCHVSRWSGEEWIKAGGKAELLEVLSHPIAPLREDPNSTWRRSQGLDGRVVFGLHQRDVRGVFSPVPLEAYARVEDESTAFVLLGGSDRYERQAAELGLRSFVRVPHSPDPARISQVLSALDVYAHGRRDGELNSVAIAEAMSLGKPVVSHDIGTANLGHVEQIGDAGFVAHSLDEYAHFLKVLKEDPLMRSNLGERARARFREHYDREAVLDHLQCIVQEVAATPRPTTSGWQRMSMARKVRLGLMNGLKQVVAETIGPEGQLRKASESALRIKGSEWRYRK